MTATISEYVEAATWVAGVLSSPPIAGIELVEEHPGSELGAYPRITFAQHAWVDESEVSEHRVWSEILLLVTAITKGESTKALKAAAIAIDQRLHRASGTTPDAQIISSVRRGGFYSVLVQPTNP